MGKAFKVTIIIMIFFSLVILAVLGTYISGDISNRINSLDNKLIIMEKKREQYSSQIINLQAVKTSMETDLAKANDAKTQQALINNLNDLNTQQALAEQQRLAAEQARLDALRQQQLQQQQTVVKTTTTKKPRTRAS